ncbi:FAD binding domain-containing protein [Sodiomyces alkalinus F11]|uniref:FAD binding domain-containing protein n=1 Tax=Sodiomyces alkalinus (strain CBS 110278 / VKM F-3762 / F11) TaxID=1314773 RepID=A0A3N2QAD9_SODAK|nr:FAD binding domain-containing protein [Sodiomyces alkalinus F11]ROT43687.1 FAD binding domain-containing protein [Sodiomyces alkalinus F11]
MFNSAFFMFRLVLAVATLASVSLADTCDDVTALGGIEVVSHRLSLQYIREQKQYWSTAAGDLKPSCLLYPQTTDELVAIVSILRDNNETFAVKSGGHNPNNYFSSVHGGPLISTAKLNQVTLDPEAETVRVGPGNRWEDVSEALQRTGYSAVGGRIGNVGVGGYILGGGLSFMSTQYGWAANSVLEFELVLPNATVISVTDSSSPDLFRALKGGGNAYGVVASFLLQAYPQGEVWGGVLTYLSTPKTDAAMLRAIREFTEHYPDEKAAIIPTAILTAGGALNIWILFVYYNGPSPPAGTFDAFAALQPFANTARTQSYHSLVTSNNFAVVEGSVYHIGTETMPLPDAANVAVLDDIYEHWKQVRSSILLVPGMVGNVAFQPLPRGMARIAREKGGDLLDLDDSVDRVVLAITVSHLLDVNSPRIQDALRSGYSGMREIVLQATREGRLPEAYLPLFMNDGFYEQDYFGRLSLEMAELAARVQEEVDPSGMFRNRTGGFKP